MESAVADPVHQAHVERTMKELQRAITDSEDALAELRRTVGPTATAAGSLARVRTGYEQAARAKPFLPFVDSVLPAVLAMRKTQQVVVEAWACTAAQEQELEAARRRLAAERVRLEDQQALQRALEARLSALRSGQDAQRERTPAQQRQERLAVLQTQKRQYDGDTSALLRALKTFIHARLGPMLAAEELGGPVVGDMVDVEAEDLTAGFSAQGKLRRTRTGDGEAGEANAAKKTKRQRRIDEIWGRAGRGDGDEHDEQEDHDDNDNDNGHDGRDIDRNEAEAAGAEMQELTEALLNGLAEAGGDSSAAYVTLARESAAARFLVRSKVAQFHPRDATKLRLIDFGRELED